MIANNLLSLVFVLAIVLIALKFAGWLPGRLLGGGGSVVSPDMQVTCTVHCSNGTISGKCKMSEATTCLDLLGDGCRKPAGDS